MTAAPRHRMLDHLRARIAGAIAGAVAATFVAATPAAALRAISLGTFSSPVDVVTAPGWNRDLYVVEQSGAIVLIRDGTRSATPFLDLTTTVLFEGERGLLSVAFPPDHATTRRFYVFFVNKSGDVEIDEYRRSTRDGRIGDPATRRVVLVVPHPGASNHNGGRLQFDTGGLLYVSIGDGGAHPTLAFDRTKLLGKLLRIDPRADGAKPYRIPPDNPYVGHAPMRAEIWSFGLRNPWRWSLADGMVAIGDVGQSQQEEVDILSVAAARGANFGWPRFEGRLLRYSTVISPTKPRFPALVYSHDGGGCAIVGGHVVKAPDLPSLKGRYVYGDFCTGVVRSFVPDPTNNKAIGDAPIGLTFSGLTSIGADVAGRLHVTAGDEVFRIAP